MAQNANDIYTMTPGSAVADTLQSILTRQEVEKRQRMLDTVNAANVQSEIGTREDNAATNKTYREGLIADRQAREAERQATQGRLKALSDYASQQYPADEVENNMWRTIEADPEKGMPMYQAWMAHKLANDGKAKKQVPQYVIHYGKSVAEPVMEPATPPLLGTQPHMVDDGPGATIHEAQPNNPPATPAQQYFDAIDPQGNRVAFRVGPIGDPAQVKLPAGFRLVGRLGVESNKLPVGLYPPKAATDMVNAVKANPRAAATAVETFISQITDPALKWDVAEFMRSPQRKALGVENAVNDLQLPAGVEDPDGSLLEAYKQNFRQLLNIIRQTGYQGASK